MRNAALYSYKLFLGRLLQRDTCL